MTKKEILILIVGIPCSIALFFLLDHFLGSDSDKEWKEKRETGVVQDQTEPQATGDIYTFTDEKAGYTYKMTLNPDGSATIIVPPFSEEGDTSICYCSWISSSLIRVGQVEVSFSDYKPIIMSWSNPLFTVVHWSRLYCDTQEMYVYPTYEHFKAKNPNLRLKLERVN